MTAHSPHYWMTLRAVTDLYQSSSPFRNKNILILTHAKKVTAALAQSCVNLGGHILFVPVRYSCDDTVLNTLRTQPNVSVFSSDNVLTLASQADIIIEDGARVGRQVVRNLSSIKLRDNVFSVEQTTSGIRYYQQLPTEKLPFPVINVGESRLKVELENTFATPQSIIVAFLSRTNVTLSGKRVMIIGYGAVGHGIARLCRAFGSNVTIIEKDPVRRFIAQGHGLIASSEKFLHKAIQEQDIVISCTANPEGSTISLEEIFLMKDCSLVFNAGSGRGEVASSLLREGIHEIHRGKIEVRCQGGDSDCVVTKEGAEKHIKILGEAHPINLRIGEGSPAEIIDVIFSLMLLSAIRFDADKPQGKRIVSVDRETEEQIIDLLDSGDTLKQPSFLDAKDLRPQIRPFGTVTPIGVSGTFLERSSIAKAVFHSGQKTAGHYHLSSEEVYIVERGEGTVEVWPVGDPKSSRVYSLQPGTFLSIPPGYAHRVQASSSEDFVTLVVASPPFSFWDQYFPA